MSTKAKKDRTAIWVALITAISTIVATVSPIVAESLMSSQKAPIVKERTVKQETVKNSPDFKKVNKKDK